MSINNHLQIKTEPQITTLELFPLEKISFAITGMFYNSTVVTVYFCIWINLALVSIRDFILKCCCFFYHKYSKLLTSWPYTHTFSISVLYLLEKRVGESNVCHINTTMEIKSEFINLAHTNTGYIQTHTHTDIKMQSLLSGPINHSRAEAELLLYPSAL